MTYQEALTITRNFVNKWNKKSYRKTEAELVQYGEACQFLKGIGSK